MSPTPESEDELILVPERSAVEAGGREVVLTPTQFRLVAVLVGEPNRVLTRAELIEQAIGTFVEERTVDVHIKEIRRKFGSSGGRIEAVRGKGYRYRGDTAEATEATPDGVLALVNPSSCARRPVQGQVGSMQIAAEECRRRRTLPGPLVLHRPEPSRYGDGRHVRLRQAGQPGAGSRRRGPAGSPESARRRTARSG